jgi:hypothetical protein
MQGTARTARAVRLSLFEMLLPSFLPHHTDSFVRLFFRHRPGLIGQVEFKDFTLIGVHNKSVLDAHKVRKGPFARIYFYAMDLKIARKLA